MADLNKQPIIIKKIKKGGHGGHHGGAWKVAYADFVTAMMAFFLLLWLLSAAPKKTLDGIADYFAPTVGLRDQQGIGFKGGVVAVSDGKGQQKNSTTAIVIGSPSQGVMVKMPDAVTKKLEMIDAKNFSSMEHDLYKAIEKNSDLSSMGDSVKVDETPEGMRIQIVDQDRRPMFVPGTSTLQPYTKKLLAFVAKYIKYLPNYISIDGHTSLDRLPTKTYDDWVLSSERANATRKFLVDDKHLDKEQIARIVGKAAVEPIDSAHPEAPSNMRISMVLLRNTLMPYQKQSALDDVVAPNEDKNINSAVGK